MNPAELKLPSPRAVLLASVFLVACAWLFLDLAVRDPGTVLFAFIALGSDFVVRNLASGPFMDRYWLVPAAARVFFCALFFVLPALGLRWLGRRRLSPEGVSALILAWLGFYVSALVFLFDLSLVIRLL